MRERKEEQTADIPQQVPNPVPAGTPGGDQIDPNIQGTSQEKSAKGTKTSPEERAHESRENQTTKNTTGNKA